MTRWLRDGRVVAVRWIWQLVFRMVRPRAQVLVYGWPDSEENALRFAVHAARYGSRPVYLIAEDPDRAKDYVAVMSALMPGSRDARVTIVRKGSLAALVHFARAEVVAYTHGLFSSPPSGDGRVHVNLWHGHGPKRLAGSAIDLRRASDLLVANTTAWGAFNAHALGTPETELLTTGDPRQDAFDDPVPESLLRGLGLEPDAPLVLWLPTFRKAQKSRGPQLRDGEALSTLTDVRALMQQLQSSAERAGVQLVIKPHPFDRDTFSGTGIRVITTDDIYAAGGTLYSLLGASAGLVSDYSSAWVEYLELDRPVGLFCPDLAEYEMRRGFKEPTVRAVAKGLMLETPADCDAFMNEAAAPPQPTDQPPDQPSDQQDAREACRRALGVSRGANRTAALMARIEELLVDAHARGAWTRGARRKRRIGTPTT